MLKVFYATLSPMLVIFICMLIGYVLYSKKLVPPDSPTVISRLENYILVPALIINTFVSYCTLSSVTAQYRLILYSCLALGAALLLSNILGSLFSHDKYFKNVYKYALTFANFSYMGNAIVPEILGEEALYNYMLFSLPINIAVYTWGFLILIPRGKNERSVLKSLINPVFISIALGTVLGISGAGRFIPAFVMSAVRSLASCMGPLAMVLTGMVIGKYDARQLLKNKKVYIVALLRLVALPALFLFLLVMAAAPKMLLCLLFLPMPHPLG